MTLTALLAEKTNLIGDLETQNEMLRTASGDQRGRDQQDQLLVQACESDKVAASMAMKQNQELKEQLAELQMAIIKLVSWGSLSREWR